MVLPPSQNIVGVCNKITLPIPYYMSSKLVTRLKIIDTSKQVYDIFYFTAILKLISFTFQIFLLFVPEMSTSFISYIV
jgi:hypothetical protein